MPLTPAAAQLAAKLILNGFTVYVDPAVTNRLDNWFHFSRPDRSNPDRDTTLFGTAEIHDGITEFRMPVVPTVKYGSSITIQPPVAYGSEDQDVASAYQVTQPENYGIYVGVTLKNAQPWSIGTHYLPGQIAIVAG